MKLNDSIAGFRLVEERHVPEADSIGRIFVHEKTGARLLHLENNDSNKVFGVGFRTPSMNSTGVAHIIEHSVLKKVSYQGTIYGPGAYQLEHLSQCDDLLR